MKAGLFFLLVGIVSGGILTLTWLFSPEEPEYDELGQVYLWCQPCQKTLDGSYFINNGYWFECSTCETIYSNEQWKKVGNQKYIELFGVDLIGGETRRNQ